MLKIGGGLIFWDANQNRGVLFFQVTRNRGGGGGVCFVGDGAGEGGVVMFAGGLTWGGSNARGVLFFTRSDLNRGECFILGIFVVVLKHSVRLLK